MNNPKQLSIKCLLDGRDNYTIPMYQRNYAWEEGEITQLIQDIMKNDRAIRDITHPWMNELSTLINTIGTQHKLELSCAANNNF